RQMESILLSGELDPRRAKGITLQVEWLICEANTLGSCGYVYIAIYPTASKSSGQ
ncbi:type IV toxin-antitoxin system YeeU family antitoxin, partial [Escherichia coli]